MFTRRSIALSTFADQDVMVRFSYDIQSGTFFFQTDSGVGFYIDDIFVTEAEEFFEEVIRDVSLGTSFDFQPAQPGQYSLSVRAKVSESFLPWGPSKQIMALIGESPKADLRIHIGFVSPDVLNGGNFVQVVVGADEWTSGTVEIESAQDLAGPWTVVFSQRLRAGISEEFRPILSSRGRHEFYRARIR